MRFFLTVAIFALLTSAAYAQREDKGAAKWDPPPKVDENAYRDAVNRIPDKKGASDPWGTVRPAEVDSKKKKN
jgi:hypothetical protein